MEKAKTAAGFQRWEPTQRPGVVLVLNVTTHCLSTTTCVIITKLLMTGTDGSSCWFSDKLMSVFSVSFSAAGNFAENTENLWKLQTSAASTVHERKEKKRYLL